MDDLISRQEAIKAICEDGTWLESQGCTEITMAERKQRDADILSDLPSAQTDLIAKIRNGIKAIDADDVYSCGMRNGMRWCMSLIDDQDPLYENCPSAERKGKWIDMNTLTTMYMPRYKCSICEEWANKSNYCPNCGADMRGEDE